MTKNQLESFAIKLHLITSEIKSLADQVDHINYSSDTEYYGTLLDEDVEFVNYKVNDIKNKLIFIDDFLSQEVMENFEAQELIKQIKAEVNEEQLQFESNFKETID